MAYSSLSALKSALLDALVEAVDDMAELVEEEVDDAVMHYYQSYDPRKYDRTGTLSYAPRRNAAKQTGDGAAANVYMDTGLQYAKGLWSMQNVISAADAMTHGGMATNGVSIWRQPMGKVEKKSRQMWLQVLRDAGIPVK